MWRAPRGKRIKLVRQQEAKSVWVSKREEADRVTHVVQYIFHTCWTAACFAHNYEHKSLDSVRGCQGGESEQRERQAEREWEREDGKGWQRADDEEKCVCVCVCWAQVGELRRGRERERRMKTSGWTQSFLMLKTTFQLQFSLFEARDRGTKRFPVLQPTPTHHHTHTHSHTHAHT